MSGKVEESYTWTDEELEKDYHAELFQGEIPREHVTDLPSNSHELDWFILGTPKSDDEALLFAYDEKNQCAYWIDSTVCNRVGPTYIGDIESFMKAKVAEIEKKLNEPDPEPTRAIKHGEPNEFMDLTQSHIVDYFKGLPDYATEVATPEQVLIRDKDGNKYRFVLAVFEGENEGAQDGYWELYINDKEKAEYQLMTQEELVQAFHNPLLPHEVRDTNKQQGVKTPDIEEFIPTVVKVQELAAKADKGSEPDQEYLDKLATQYELDLESYMNYTEMVNDMLNRGIIPRAIDTINNEDPQTPIIDPATMSAATPYELPAFLIERSKKADSGDAMAEAEMENWAIQHEFDHTVYDTWEGMINDPAIQEKLATRSQQPHGQDLPREGTTDTATSTTTDTGAKTAKPKTPPQPKKGN